MLLYCLGISMITNLSRILELTVHGKDALPQLCFGQCVDPGLGFIPNLGQHSRVLSNRKNWSARAPGIQTTSGYAVQFL